MPPPLLERLALELFGLLVPLLFVVIVFRPGQADHLELQAEQHADRRLDGAHIQRTQQHEHIDKLELLYLAGRVRIDQHLNVRRPFEQLTPPVMLNAKLARGANFRGRL